MIPPLTRTRSCVNDYRETKMQRTAGTAPQITLAIDPFQRRVWTEGERSEGFPTDLTSLFDAGQL